MTGTRFLAILIFAAALIGPAYATVPLDGHFIAEQECPAYSSFRKKKNPGNVRLVSQRAYQVVGKNKSNATHYWLRIKDASPQERWVAVSCGTLLTDCRSSQQAQPQPGPVPGVAVPEGTAGKEYLLAVSWQPAFCQGHRHKPECESQTEHRFDARHFTLHGLWPQPRNNTYCGVSNRDKRMDKRKAWSQLPALGLSEQTFSDLTVVMPGVSSFLQRHEWTKHGTCYSDSPETYFQDSLEMMDQLNGSEVQALFAGNIGQEVSAEQIRESFDRSFGPGTGNKVKIKCSGGMITELWLNLKGSVRENSTLAGLLSFGADAGDSCGAGLVDAVGF